MHPIISSCYPVLLLHSGFPALGSLPMNHLFTSGGQNIGASASASVLQMNIQDWFPLGLTGLILLSKRLSRVFFSTTVWKHPFFSAQPSLWSTFHIHTWLLQRLGLYGPLLVKWCLCFLIHCQVCHCFSSKQQASFNFLTAVTVHSDFGAQENKICHFLPIYLPWSYLDLCLQFVFLSITWKFQTFSGTLSVNLRICALYHCYKLKCIQLAQQATGAFQEISH